MTMKHRPKPVKFTKQADAEKAILEAIEREQRRIGHDLHDGLCQQLAGVALIAKALAQKLAIKGAGESDEADEIAGLINLAIDQTRDLARGLSPVEMELVGLAPALQKFADTIERHYKISCVFLHDEKTDLHYAHASLSATHLYRIVQEAANNAIKHGKAGRIVIALSTVRDRGLLTVKDDGVGFQARDGIKPGLGLRSMRYRCKMIGARFKIGRAKGGGTLVSCSFPTLGRRLKI